VQTQASREDARKLVDEARAAVGAWRERGGS